MLWNLANHLFSTKKARIYLKEILPQDNRAEGNEKAYDHVFVKEVNDVVLAKMKQAMQEMEFNPPFTLEDIVSRMQKGHLLQLVLKGPEIAGWSWFAVNEVYCEDFEHSIQLKQGHAYAYNIYISKKFRGNDLGKAIMERAEQLLSSMGIHTVWVLIYEWNTASLKTVEKSGFRDVGQCRFVKFLGAKFHRYPEAVVGGRQ